MKPSVHRILVLDDDRLFCKAIAAVGRRLGVAVIYATSMDQIEILRHLSFDAIVMDCDLEEGSGIELAKEVRAIADRDIPVVLTSYVDRGETIANPWPRSVRGFVPKSQGYQAILDAAVAARHFKMA